jgi:hypothetical protein
VEGFTGDNAVHGGITAHTDPIAFPHCLFVCHLLGGQNKNIIGLGAHRRDDPGQPVDSAASNDLLAIMLFSSTRAASYP